MKVMMVLIFIIGTNSKNTNILRNEFETLAIWRAEMFY